VANIGVAGGSEFTCARSAAAPKAVKAEAAIAKTGKCRRARRENDGFIVVGP
jgi:hypothetical protein